MSTLNQAELEKILRQQETLRQIIESISSELELRPLLTSIVQHACELLAADRGTIGLVDEARPVIRTEAVYRMPPDELGAEMGVGVGLAGQVLASQEPLILNHYGELNNPTQEELVQDAVIGLPIFWRDRMIGFFGIGAAPPRIFNEQDVELLTQLARHAGIAIENARLFAAERRRAARQATLNRIGEIIASTLDLEELLQSAITAVREQLHFADAGVLLKDDADAEMLILVARSGIYAELLPEEYRQSIHQGIIGATARARRPVFTQDAVNDPRYLPVPGAEGIRSVIGIPIIVSDQLLGVLNVESSELLAQDDVDLLQIVGDQLGVAIVNARLFDQTQRNLAETQLLYETSRRITNAFDVGDVIEAYLQLVAVRGRYVCNVALYDFDDFGERTAVIIRGLWSPEEGLQLLQHHFPYSKDALDPMLDAGQTVTMANVHEDPRASEILRQMQAEVGRPALAMIPLIVRRQRIGLVILSYSAVYEWSASDLWPYQVTAAQLATAIDTRQQQLLLVQSGQEMAVLHERQRLARELHDSVTQLVFSITLVAQSLAPAWHRDPAEGKKRVDRLLELSQGALAEMRTLLFELRSTELPPLPTETGVRLPGVARLRRDGLVKALEKYIGLLVHNAPAIELQADTYRPHSLEYEVTLFRIAQEALNNVVKYAQATEVQIRLYEEADSVCLVVIDNGVGFDVAQAQDGRSGNKKGGFGLHTMQERAQAHKGQVTIRSASGQGTAVTVCLPQENGGHSA
ncbi:MAG: GAF domain-containing protein [Anaerolineales bacterium]|nr:GAF domain-containing protein [Anaerolineales bacterium]